MKCLNVVLAGLFILISAQKVIGQHKHINHNGMYVQPVESEHSIYHIDAMWTDHRMETFKLADLQGQPVVVVMYYGSCTQVCPILIRDARRVFEAVDENLRSEVKVLAVTFDPENDTPATLQNYAIKYELDIPQWHFTRGNSADIRELAMLLGVQYAKKNDGHFSHSNLVTVLDGEGKIVHRLEGLNQPVEEAVQWINKELHHKHQTKGS